ncbi:alcohol dehydrogenase catalytic domain-containing protein [Pontiella sulfatireligans]|uniref:Erythritol/L-threitol dehydrogenase n=1 Tax=Pontiella sulfatireligans TaxID=2750658 RepID=A0A6C2UTU3_9BACT|nr:alcohol dehydrogenase catalytic domain-containing protein [Pontiella sulfatireligans]VGO23383.1 Erythritol/L-threitol dehydrogenase [Pontiella sulfatireligans]
MATIKGVVYYAPGDIRVEQVAMPENGADELLVKVDACAVCGTDLKSMIVGNPRIQAPRIMGHEFTGIIENVGASVEGFAVGERIVMATSVSCGECFYCKKGHNNLCAELAPMGFSYEGGMAEYIVIPARAIQNGHVIKVPASVKAEHAALAEPLSCAVNSCENCNIQEGDSVVVIGAGPMGILNACAAREMGAGKIIMAEINPARLSQCGPFADLLVNPAEQDLEQIVKDETDGIGADVVIVAAPAASPQEQALFLVRKQGTVCLFASLPVGKSMLNIDSRLVHYGEIKLVGSSDSTPAHVAKAVEMIAGGTLRADLLATHMLPLEGIFEAYELMKSGESLRVVLTP